MNEKYKIIILSILLIVLICIGCLMIFNNEDNIKKYQNANLTFNYISKYKVIEQDNYIELKSDNSNIIVENRHLNSIENNATFESIVDNIIYEYLTQNKNYKLISQYNDYVFSKDKLGYRLIYENISENLNTLMLITLENLNLTVVTMNAYAKDFELLIDSAELVMSSMNHVFKANYIDTVTIYPKENFPGYVSKNTKDIAYNMDKYTEYLKIVDNYVFSVNVSDDLTLYEDESTYLEFSNDEMLLKYTIDDYSSVEYSKEWDFYLDDYKCSPTDDNSIICTDDATFEEYEVRYGYKKYNNEMYYVTWQNYKGTSSYDEILTLTLPLNSKYVFKIAITLEGYQITDELINEVLNYTIRNDAKHSEISDNYITGQLITKKDNDTNQNGIKDNDYIKIAYSIPQKYDVSIWTSYNSDRVIKLPNFKVTFEIRYSFSRIIYSENTSKYYENYKIKEYEDVAVNGYKYTKYVETYEYVSNTYIKKYYSEYYRLKLSDDFYFWAHFECDSKENCSDERVKEILNLKISEYRYGE